ncbi:YitT family protein [Mycoplasma sp. T363T]|uniref:YitT family protein n=1 Tax=Mycoplasma bradburyae TaxID=2963128 RepID=A0AAW6HP74_9MOLU|nr:YitT family protein [Mycoplasma bradburyae]MDC4162972.1 YitT family protein [Mycoplasma bradburyae]MDC4181583.1 YitT family protein [Mycoplasma bradburyae]MDC4182309.1 YitT family protein [Mycoplasma bradburyae]MDC4183036.1 YitT family protein [Mycoplasma bradburyae]UTS69994.1 YitT family protein [Mycoplasma bradburyae]
MSLTKSKNKLANLSQEWNKVTVTRTRLRSSLLIFAGLYGPKKIWNRIAIIVLISLIQGLISLFFIRNSGLYNLGVSSLTQGLARMLFVILPTGLPKDLIFNLTFWILYIVINIPLIIFSYFKVGKRFTILTAVYVVIANLFGFVLDNIPGISKVGLFTINTAENSSIIYEVEKFKSTNLEIYRMFFDDTGKLTDLGRKIGYIPLIWQNNNEVNKILSMFLYAIIAAALSSFLYTMLFVIGASTGGMDFISQYVAKIKRKSIAGILFYTNFITLLVSVIIGSYIPSSLVLQEIPKEILVPNSTKKFSDLAWNVSLLFSPNFIGSILSAVVVSMFLEALFPRYKMAKIEIYSADCEKIRQALLSDHHPHTMSMSKITGGFTKEEREMITTTTMFVEIPRIIRLIRKVDNDCLIAITQIKGIDGWMYITEE